MRLTLLCGLVAWAGCAPITRPDDAPPFQQEAPQVSSRDQLGFGATGVSIDSDGQRFVWAPGQGVVQLERAGAKVVLPAAFLGERQQSSFEDLVIIDSKRVALIAQNEGIVVDRSTGGLLSRFCYLPDSTQWQDPIAWQLSRSLGYDAQEDRLYVQPQTFPGGGTTASSSQLGLFDPKKDQPLEWQDLGQATFNAGGMAVETRARTYLGMGTRLYLYDANLGSFGGYWDLFGTVQSIDGLALDRANRTLVVLDGTRRELVELKLDGLQ